MAKWPIYRETPFKGMDKLPVYEMVINPDPASDVEVSYVAFVDKPAIEKNFLAFKDQKIQFDIQEEKRIVSGPAMVANTLIYRKDEQGEYNVFFSKETIAQIALKFFKKDYQKNLNLFHDPELSLDGVTIFESFVTDKARGVQPMKGFEDLPDGTWFISAKVENDAVWNAIKDGQVKGFSVEGIFSYVKEPRGLSGLYSEIDHLKEKNFMSELKDLLKAIKAKFIGDEPVVPAVDPANPVNPVQQLAKDYSLKDGSSVNIDKMEVGGAVLKDGAAVPDGTYELADGAVITCTGGLITAITPAATDPEAQMSAVKKELERLSGAVKIIEEYKTTQSKYEERLKLADDKIKKQEETIKGIFEIVEKLADVPANDPVEPGKQNFVSEKIQSREEKLKELSGALNKLKKTA